MTRRLWVTLSVLSLILGSCARVGTTPPLPVSVSPGWRLDGIHGASSGMWIANYSGPGKARVQIWSIHSSAEGLDRTQKWQAQANTVVFYGEHYFVAVDWEGADRAQVTSLVRAIEHVLGTQPETR